MAPVTTSFLRRSLAVLAAVLWSFSSASFRPGFNTRPFGTHVPSYEGKPHCQGLGFFFQLVGGAACGFQSQSSFSTRGFFSNVPGGLLFHPAVQGLPLLPGEGFLFQPGASFPPRIHTVSTASDVFPRRSKDVFLLVLVSIGSPSPEGAEIFSAVHLPMLPWPWQQEGGHGQMKPMPGMVPDPHSSLKNQRFQRKFIFQTGYTCGAIGSWPTNIREHAWHDDLFAISRVVNGSLRRSTPRSWSSGVTSSCMPQGL